MWEIISELPRVCPPGVFPSQSAKSREWSELREQRVGNGESPEFIVRALGEQGIVDLLCSENCVVL